MPRKPRKHSNSNYYHIINRGNNKKKIFDTNNDKERFIYIMKKYKEECEVEIVSYCLMGNHFHMLIKAPNGPEKYIGKISSIYATYYNQKYNLTGHLFQGRYSSEPVETDQYFLTVSRYILRNPEKAGICDTDKYQWSSFSEIYKNEICNTKKLEELAGGTEEFIEFVLTDSNDICLDTSDSKNIADEIAVSIICDLLKQSDPGIVKELSIKKRNEILRKAKEKGIPVRQLSRITGINKDTIQRVVHG